MIQSVVNIIMGLLYAGIGMFVIKTNSLIMDLDPWAAKAFGIITIAYGIYRIYRAVRAMTSK